MKAGWAYAMQIRMEQGRWVVAALRVFPEAELLDSNRMKYLKSGPITDRAIPPGGLTARQLRQISFQEPLAPYNGLMKAAKKIADQYKITSPQTSDYDLARIAEIYVDVLCAEVRDGPIRTARSGPGFPRRRSVTQSTKRVHADS